MRVVLLTTDTPHHLYYAWRMHSAGMLTAVVMECASRPFPFPTHHPFETERDEYERSALLSGAPKSFEELVPTVRCDTVNDRDALDGLRRAEPDVILVFGTGRLLAEAASVPRAACLNLHGGNPEAYRGLDSHLWAIYHRDFENLITTLHYLEPELDSGAIVVSSKLPLEARMPLTRLRGVNTQVCVELSQLAVNLLQEGRPLPSRPQLSRGRYYSAMPAVLKDECVRRFERYTAEL